MGHLNFSWEAPTTKEDGSGLTSPLTYNLYEDGVKIVGDIAATNFSLTMEGKEYKTYSYTATAVDTVTGLESKQSNPVGVSYAPPKPPAGLKGSFSG